MAEKNDRQKQFLITFLLSAVIFIAAFMLYRNVLNYGYTHLDDHVCIQGCADAFASKTALADAFRTNVLMDQMPSPYYRPMVAVSFIIDNKIAGPSEQYAHFTSVFLHCLASVLVFLFLMKYLPFNKLIAFLAAMFFAFHPAAAYTAAWITGRNESIFFINFILSFAFFIEYAEKKKPFYLALHIIFILLCFFTKESGIIIPFIFFIYFLTTKGPARKLDIKVYALWAVSVIFFMLMRKNALTESSLSFNITKDSIGMFFDYYYSLFTLRTPFGVAVSAKTFIMGGAAMLLSIFFAFHGTDSREQKKKNLFYLLFPLVVLLPTISADGRLWFQGNRMYSPLFGITVLFFLFLSPYIKNIRTKPLAVSAAVLLLLLFSAVTQNSYTAYKDALSFWGKIYSQSANPPVLAQNIYTALLIENGNFEKAYPAALQTAERTGYSNLTALYNLADCLLAYGDYGKAAEYYEAASANTVYATAETYAKIYLCCRHLNFQEAKEHYYGLILKLSGSDEAADSYISSAENAFKKPAGNG